MQLSIIIVNYNSKMLIEVCLASINKATIPINSEVIVVDNASKDGSNEFLPSKFPSAKYIFNSENLGFSRACNQGFKISSGKYILFLNPDSVLSENSLMDCINFFETHPATGAVGVRMVNTDGVFLKESKRGVPTPAASFYKLFGLAALFPRSKKFAKYYQGHLPENKNNCVEVLSGAFMMIRRDAFEKVNGFDERFFMYGEDIDLSIRIAEAGYKTYYLGKISVTHLKGGSTTYDKKHIKDFYDAMKLFVKKYYGDKPVYASLLNAGINLRKAIALGALLFR
jgi:GT2 family glycosyltransferase